MQFPASTALRARPVKASREKVFGAADEILRGGRRPTIEAIQTQLGGGSPNAVVAYVNEWYAELGERLARMESPPQGLTPETHRAALMLQAALTRAAASGPVGENTEVLIRSMRAEVLSLQTLVDELRGQRERDQQLLAHARALLVRKDEDLQARHASELTLKASLAVAEDRLRRRAAASSRPKRAKVASPVDTRPNKGTRATSPNAKARSRPKPAARRAPSASRKERQRHKPPAHRRPRSK